MKNNLRVIEINTTAWEEENFYLLTTLSDEQITKVITPIVMNERELEKEMFKNTINDDTFKQWEEVNKYDNDSLVDALRNAYPNDIVTHYVHDGFDKITI